MKATAPLSAADLLQVGHWFCRQERLFEVTAWEATKPLYVEARAADTGQVHQFTLTELFAPEPPTRFAATSADLIDTSASDLSVLPQVVDAATLPIHLLERADRIIRSVETVRAHLQQAQQPLLVDAETVPLAELTRQACQALPSPISLSTYYAYRQTYYTHDGDRARIAIALHRSTYGKTRIDPNARHFIDTVIRRFYRSNPPLRAQTAYHIAQQVWQHNRHWWLNIQHTDAANHEDLIDRLLDARLQIDDLLADPTQVGLLTRIQLPSRSWFYGYVSWFGTQPGEGAQTYITRHGRADWEANFMLFDRFAQTATLPLQYVCADHYKLDVLYVDDEFREVLGRLWLTLLIDAYSRAILGLLLAYEDPGIASIQGALHHAIWPKTDLTAFGIDLPWICYGIPQRLFLDNAWAHHSYSLEDLARALAGGGRYTHMELVFRPPYHARYGGLIERLFGNLSGQIREQLPGTILQPDHRHWHNASQGACLLYRDVLRLLVQRIVDYMHTSHRELQGLTPHERWLSGLQLMTPVPPPLTPHLERCFWRLHPQTRVATPTGLALFGLHYWDVGLAGLRHPDRQGRRRHFHLRYDPDDVSRVAVFEGGHWLGDGYARELRLPDGSYEPVSLWELNMAKERMRRQSDRRTPYPHSWLIHLLEARELIAQRQAEQKLIRRKVQQLRERQRGRPKADTQDQRLALEDAQVQETEQALARMATQGHDPREHLLETLQEVL